MPWRRCLKQITSNCTKRYLGDYCYFGALLKINIVFKIRTIGRIGLFLHAGLCFKNVGAKFQNSGELMIVIVLASAKEEEYLVHEAARAVSLHYKPM